MAGAAAAVLLAVGAMFIGRELIAPDPAPPQPRAPSADEFARFTDAEAAFSISYPAGWRRLPSPNPEVRLLVEGDGSSMLVRVTELGVDVGPKNLDAAKRLTDKLVGSVDQAKLQRRPRRVTLGGLPGFLYLYTFPDPVTGQLGAHAHYFAFRGRTLITIVFQTVPAKRLASLAPLFDRIGESLRSIPG